MKTRAAFLNVHAVRALFALGWAWAVFASAASAADATGVQPELSISLRGTSGGTVEVGEPFRVAVRVDAPADATTKLELAPVRGSWISATTIEILSASEKSVPASARLAAPLNAEGGTIVDAENPATALWWFPAESLSGVVPGEYSVRAKLAIRDGTGWKGEVTSEPAAFRVVPLSTDPERVTQRKLSLARAAMFAGESAKAGEMLNAILETAPNLIPALVLRSALSLQGGNRVAAQVCIDRALLLSSQSGEEPSSEIYELAMRIERTRIERAPGTEVPAWTQVPRSVFEPIRTAGSTIPGIAAAEPAASKSAEPRAPIAATPPAAVPAKRADGPVVATPPSTTLSPALAPTSHAESGGVGVVIKPAELSDPKILADPAGQWAAIATAGSQYGRTQYSATQATGAPNVKVAGNSPDAWCPAVRDKGLDWLEVTFAKPVQAAELRVRQNDASGAIAKIEAIEANGTAHVWWEGADPYVVPAVREIVWFAVRVPKTSYAVARVKLTLNLASGPGYKEIDAVQLVAAP